MNPVSSSPVTRPTSSVADLHRLVDGGGFDAARLGNAGPASPDARESAVVDRLVDRANGSIARDPAAFRDAAALAFGAKADKASVDALIDAARADALPVPPVRFVDAEALGQDVFGAWDGQTIYLDRRLLNDADRLERVFTEELGHGLDTRLGGPDAAGDEGEIFSRAMLGGDLSAGALGSLRAENDHGTIDIDPLGRHARPRPAEFDVGGRRDGPDNGGVTDGASRGGGSNPSGDTREDNNDRGARDANRGGGATRGRQDGPERGGVVNGGVRGRQDGPDNGGVVGGGDRDRGGAAGGRPPAEDHNDRRPADRRPAGANGDKPPVRGRQDGPENGGVVNGGVRGRLDGPENGGVVGGGGRAPPDGPEDAGAAAGGGREKPTREGSLLSNIGHFVLDLVGLIPGIGEWADAVNAGWYGAEGRYFEASLSAAGVVPFVGIGATLGKWFGRTTTIARAEDLAAATELGPQTLASIERLRSHGFGDIADAAAESLGAIGKANVEASARIGNVLSDPSLPISPNLRSKLERAQNALAESLADNSLAGAMQEGLGIPIGEFDHVTKVNRGVQSLENAGRAVQTALDNARYNGFSPDAISRLEGTKEALDGMMVGTRSVLSTATP